MGQMKIRGSSINLGLTLLSALCAQLAGCSSQPQDLSAPADERRRIVTSLEEPSSDHLVRTAWIVDGKLVSSSLLDPPPTRVISSLTPYKGELAKTGTLVAPEALDAPLARIDELLEAQLGRAEAGAIADRRVEVTVTFKETLVLPRFPSLRDQPRDSPENEEVLARNAALVELVEEARAAEHATHTAQLVEEYGASVKETFWLSNSMRIELPLRQIRALEQHPDVQFIERVDKPDVTPPATMLEVRNLENAVPLYSFAGGYMGLLDTGIRRTHTMLRQCTATTTQACWNIALDCYNGTSNVCNSGANRNPEDLCNHGTGSAGELIGWTSNSDNRGMTLAQLDSFKVYSSLCGFDVAAGLRGFQAAASWGDNLILAEIQDKTGGYNGAISTAANSAFDANRLVIAPVGNYGPNAGSVAAPGNAQKVLGVGAIDASSQELNASSGRGPTTDLRTKPDLSGFTNITVPGSSSNSHMFSFGGTSAAAPNVAGLAMLIRNFLNQPAPGIVYASLLAIGSNPLGAQDNDTGAGVPRWPGTANLIASSVTVGASNVEVTINVTTAWNKIDVAIWWPEGLSGHKPIGLEVRRPDGTLAGLSNAPNSVFQKDTIVSTIGTGNWKIRLVSNGMASTRTVYYAWFPQKW